MNKIIISTVLIYLFFHSSYGQGYHYSLNLTEIESDELEITLDCPIITSDAIIYYFPKTIPGTYSELDYGRYIKKLSAYDEFGNKLKIKKIDINTFEISNAKTLRKIKYKVVDTFDEKVKKKNKIFEPAGTNFEKDKVFIFNNGGMFGCFENMEDQTFYLEIKKDETLNGFSSLESNTNSNEILFSAIDYHQLIDCPIFFTSKKSEQINIGGCNINIATYANSDSSSYYVKKEILDLFNAIELFTGRLPVLNYNLLIYYEDMIKDIEKLNLDTTNLSNISLVKALKFQRLFKGKAFGALEHGTSSLYFLPYLENMDYTSNLTDVIIHEFMHIYTPLSLHSNLIGDFNYLKPQMSQHLWLYEGITEYFSLQIQMQGKLIDFEDLLYGEIKQKIESSLTYPDSIPFTEMSMNVLEDPYKELYMQVYDRGAIMAMLLDFEIMRLTSGNQTLKSVIFELAEKYGPNKSFNEDTFISEFVSLINPDLQKFFDDYVSGKKPLDIKGGFEVVGIKFDREQKGKIPVNILSKKENDIKYSPVIVNGKKKITKVGPNELVGFKKGDLVDIQESIDCYRDQNGDFVPAGTIIFLNVLRDNREVKLSFAAKYKEGSLFNVLKIDGDKTIMQQKLFDIWTN